MEDIIIGINIRIGHDWNTYMSKYFSILNDNKEPSVKELNIKKLKSAIELANTYPNSVYIGDWIIDKNIKWIKSSVNELKDLLNKIIKQ